MTHHCPRCRGELAADPDHEVWRCLSCFGLAMSTAMLIDELARDAPSVVPRAGAHSIATIARNATEQIACSRCEQPMEPVYLGGVDLDRCRACDLFWFDYAERERVIEAAQEQSTRWMPDWLRRLVRR